METLMADFAAWLKVEREARGWTQAEMATAIGVALNTVARWERGERTPSELAQVGIREAIQRKGKR